MSIFAPQASPSSPPDPDKHVNFTRGMVLGEEDFKQEFAYLAGRDQWLARSVGGYGTVWGLQVVVEDDGANGPRVLVKPGAALSPPGQMICVPSEQCASLNAWLAKQNANQVSGSSVQLYVTLCYRDCPTNLVPIPGEPCRSEDDSMAPSRLQDDYLLELQFEPPEQFEEDGLRKFACWLRAVPLEFGAGASTLDDLLNALRRSLHVDLAATPPSFVFDPPDPTLRIPIGEVTSYWRAAFRVWTTEFRPRLPRWIGAGGKCAMPPAEERVLLAQLTVPLAGGKVAGDAKSVTVAEDSRPYLLHQRMLQEWDLTISRATGTPPDSPPDSVPAPSGNNLARGVAATPGEGLHHKPIDAAAPTDRQVSTSDAAADSQLAASPTPAGDAVIHPANLPTYAMAAAGVVRGDGSSHGPVYNELHCSVPDDGLIRLEFGAAEDRLGYRVPDTSFQYIVKVLPVYDGNPPPEVAFSGHGSEGIELVVMRDSVRIPIQRLLQMYFMVEVSYFEQ